MRTVDEDPQLGQAELADPDGALVTMLTLNPSEILL